MKYSAVCKLLAILLCAAMLLAAAASGFAIFALNETGLYRQSWVDAYDDYRGALFQNTADSIAVRYAARELGGLNDQMIQDYYGDNWHMQQFAFGQMAYVLHDEKGNPLEDYAMTGSYPMLEKLQVVVAPMEYPKVVQTITLEQWDILNGKTEPVAKPYIAMGEDSFYDAVPTEGALVTHITVSYGDSSEGVGSPEGLGTIFHNVNGHVEFRADMGGILDVSRRSELTGIRFENEELGLLCEITGPKGVGILYTDPATGNLVFCSNEPNPDFVPEESATVDPTVEEPSVLPPTANIPLETENFAGASIYDIPSEEGTVVGTLSAEDAALTFRVFQVEGKTWFLCEKGWVLAAETELPDAAPETGHDEEGRMEILEETPVYSTPNRDAAPLGTLRAGMVITPIRTVSVQGEDWILISEGWLRLNGEAEPTEPTEITEATEATETMATEPTVQETIPSETTAELPEFDTVLRYYDRGSKQEMVALCTMAQAPGYTVDFTYAQGALEGDYFWNLLALAANFQEYLIPTLIGSVLLFALLLVYLCCAAGHSRSSDVVRAGGLNRIPLDLWFILLCAGLTGAALLGAEGIPNLMKNSMEVGVVFAAALGYGASLLAVCFCFACAAQFNSRDGYWWRNSLTGLCLRFCWRSCSVLWRWFCRLCRWLFSVSDGRLVPMAERLWKALCKLTKALALLLWGWFCKGLRGLLKLADWCRIKMERFISMLPMTWQWLLAGFAMILLLALTLTTHLAVWGICLSIALILYGTHAFGTLLEGARRMNRGDLEEKVDEKLLIGSFREFAGELNGLADVAVVAAQKQLKSERMKTELITNVSHDIKTPLTSIINYVDLLEKPHTPEEQEVYLEVLSRQSQSLKKLIEDLMEMSKASTGNMAVDITTVDAVEAVNQALGEFADKLSKADLIPVLRHSEERLPILADGRLLWRVLSNLLSNAVKYALPGTRLYLDVAGVDDKVIISMKNISREELNVSADELLERFVRGDASRNTEGSGLGLNIAQSLMELQKGSLQILVDGDLFKVTLILPAA